MKNKTQKTIFEVMLIFWVVICILSLNGNSSLGFNMDTFINIGFTFCGLDMAYTAGKLSKEDK